MSYSYDKFLRPLTESDVTIKILDNNNDIKYTIDPFVIISISISNNILKISLKSKSILIDFSSINEAKLALIRIQEQIDILVHRKFTLPFTRITESQRLEITTLVVGLHVYQTDSTEGVYVYKSSGWEFAY